MAGSAIDKLQHLGKGTDILAVLRLDRLVMADKGFIPFHDAAVGTERGQIAKSIDNVLRRLHHERMNGRHEGWNTLALMRLRGVEPGFNARSVAYGSRL